MFPNIKVAEHASRTNILFVLATAPHLGQRFRVSNEHQRWANSCRVFLQHQSKVLFLLVTLGHFDSVLQEVCHLQLSLLSQGFASFLLLYDTAWQEDQQFTIRMLVDKSESPSLTIYSWHSSGAQCLEDQILSAATLAWPNCGSLPNCGSFHFYSSRQTLRNYIIP